MAHKLTITVIFDEDDESSLVQKAEEFMREANRIFNASPSHVRARLEGASESDLLH